MDRRKFLKCLAGGSALSLYAVSELNAEIYKNIVSLNNRFLKQESPDGAYWDALQKHYLFEDGFYMMNNGTAGPMPRPVFNTLMHYFEKQVTNPYDVYNYLPTKIEAVRKNIAGFIGASPDEIAVTRNTTEGLNFIVSGLDMKEGDEVIMSNMEHPGGYNPWRLKEKRYGVKIKEVKLGLPPKSVDEVVDSFKKAITPKTRMIFISHTVYKSGLISPIKELSKLAHDNGLLILADSAHGIGMLNLNMRDMGVDFWASSPYKWLGAPTGVGVLFAKKESQDKIWPTIATSGWDTNKNAKRFETLGQRADPLTLALGEAVEFQKVIGKARIDRRIKALAKHLKDGLRSIPGVKIHTSDDTYLSGGLTAFSIKGVDDLEKVVNYVREKYNIVIRTVGSKDDGTYAIRVSTNIFISKKHIDLLLEGINYLVRKKG
ncbi:aminotransferase class V-fold PLP-dependent enzyme [candidate division KSB1 bacterium]